jgi:hypothetical protein
MDIFVPREEYHLPVKSEVESHSMAHSRGIMAWELGLGLIVTLIRIGWILLVERASDHC